MSITNPGPTTNVLRANKSAVQPARFRVHDVTAQCANRLHVNERVVTAIDSCARGVWLCVTCVSNDRANRVVRIACTNDWTATQKRANDVRMGVRGVVSLYVQPTWSYVQKQVEWCVTPPVECDNNCIT
jgi:hypothetical protein